MAVGALRFPAAAISAMLSALILFPTFGRNTVAASGSTPNTIVSIVVGSTDFDTLEIAVVQAGLVDALADPTASLTVLAPTDDAFAKLPRDLVSQLLLDEFRPQLADLLLYHVLPGKIPSPAITDQLSKQTLNGEDVTFTVDSDGDIVVDTGNAVVLQPDIGVDNGVIHIIDRVLTPSWVGKTLLDVAADDPNFSTLLSLASIFDSIPEALDLGGPFTLFAPPNSVFASIQQSSPDIFAALPFFPDTLKRILEAHIIPGVVTFDRIPSGETKVEALSGDKLTIVKDDGKVTVNGISVTVTDILAENGVIHVLDGLIVPGSIDLSDLTEPKPYVFISEDPDDSFLPLSLCEGDCDDDDDCAGNLVCVQRTKGEPIPGCSGSLSTYADFCTLPSSTGGGPTPSPPSPEFPFNLCSHDCGPGDDCSGDLVITQRGREGKVWIVPCSS